MKRRKYLQGVKNKIIMITYKKTIKICEYFVLFVQNKNMENGEGMKK